MSYLTDECARILNCSVKNLRDRLNHPTNRAKILKELTGKHVRTTYCDRNGNQKLFCVGGLTSDGAAHLMAYGRLPRPFNTTVAAHYYARHRIRLHYPYLHCIIEKTSKGGEDYYYPLELLELVNNKEEIWLGSFWSNSNSSIASTLEIVSEEGIDEPDLCEGRNQCSLDTW